MKHKVEEKEAPVSKKVQVKEDGDDTETEKKSEMNNMLDEAMKELAQTKAHTSITEEEDGESINSKIA